MRPVISVVIPSYRSAKHIRGCLQGLQQQDCDVPHEIIVVDSSDDGTDRIVADEFPYISLIHFEERHSVGSARNIGKDAAQGEFILFIDTDCVPSPSWMRHMYTVFREQGADGIGGAMANGTPESLTGSIGFYLEFFHFTGRGGQPFPSAFLVGGNSAYRREVLAGQRYTDHSVGEDLLFTWRLAMKGKKLLFVPAAEVRHMNRRGLKNVTSYQRELGRGAYRYRSHVSPRAVAILRAFPPLIFCMPFAVMPWIASHLLRRARLSDFLRFILLSPLCLIAHGCWARGFFEQMREAGTTGVHR